MQRQGTPHFDLPGLPSYFGGKGSQAAFRRIINALPPHRVYIEAFGGSLRIMRHKMPAPDGNHALELDPTVFKLYPHSTLGGYTFHCGDAFTILPDLVSQYLRHGQAASDILVYVDPPYLLHTRRNSRPAYSFEFHQGDHELLASHLQRLSCRVVLSHLPCPEYSALYHSWHTFTFQNATRHGPQTEQVWCNYAPTVDLHEYTFVGDNKRHREQIRRHFGVILRRAAKLPPSARVALAAALEGLNQRVG